MTVFLEADGYYYSSVFMNETVTFVEGASLGVTAEVMYYLPYILAAAFSAAAMWILKDVLMPSPLALSKSKSRGSSKADKDSGDEADEVVNVKQPTRPTPVKRKAPVSRDSADGGSGQDS